MLKELFVITARVLDTGGNINLPIYYGNLGCRERERQICKNLSEMTC